MQGSINASTCVDVISSRWGADGNLSKAVCWPCTSSYQLRMVWGGQVPKDRAPVLDLWMIAVFRLHLGVWQNVVGGIHHDTRRLSVPLRAPYTLACGEPCGVSPPGSVSSCVVARPRCATSTSGHRATIGVDLHSVSSAVRIRSLVGCRQACVGFQAPEKDGCAVEQHLEPELPGHHALLRSGNLTYLGGRVSRLMTARGQQCRLPRRWSPAPLLHRRAKQAIEDKSTHACYAAESAHQLQLLGSHARRTWERNEVAGSTNK